MAALRVIDAGTVSPLRSQALWHALATAMRAGDTPVLSFCRPAAPYVGIGYHRRLDELDLTACAQERLPVLRRRIGGGPVWLDGDQLFFQLTLPAADAPADVARLYRRALGPAIVALRGLGLDVRLDGPNDIVIATPGETEGRKLSGTGAGRIDDGVVVVGNVLFRFPHERMAGVLALPDERMRADVLALMRRHVSSLDAEGFGALGHDQVRAALAVAYAREFGSPAHPARLDGLGDAEAGALAQWERRLASRSWLRGPTLAERSGRLVKVRRDVHLAHAADGRLSIVTAIEGDRLRDVRISAPHLNGRAVALEQVLAGAPASTDELTKRLQDFGMDGRRIVRALAPVLARRD